MSEVIADTGPLVAYLVKEDAQHAWAVEQFQRLPAPFLTCEAVLTEAFFLVRNLRHGPSKFFALLNRGVLRVDFSLLNEVATLEQLVRKYADVPMSLADACLVRLAELNPEASVFTLDHDFQIFRQHGRQVIPTIMPPEV